MILILIQGLSKEEDVLPQESVVDLDPLIHTNIFSHDTRICAYCVEGTAETVQLTLCSGCRTVYYCGKACQTADWKRHRPTCRAVAQESELARQALRMAQELSHLSLVFWTRNQMFDPTYALTTALALESSSLTVYTLAARRQGMRYSFFLVPNKDVARLAAMLRAHLALDVSPASSEILLVSESRGRMVTDNPFEGFSGNTLYVQSLEKPDRISMNIFA